MKHAIENILKYSPTLNSQWEEASNIITLVPRGNMLEVIFSTLALYDCCPDNDHAESGDYFIAKLSVFKKALDKYAKEQGVDVVVGDIKQLEHYHNFKANGPITEEKHWLPIQDDDYEQGDQVWVPYALHSFTLGPFKNKDVSPVLFNGFMVNDEGEDLILLTNEAEKQEIKDKGIEAMQKWLQGAYSYGSDIDSLLYETNPGWPEILQAMYAAKLICKMNSDQLTDDQKDELIPIYEKNFPKGICYVETEFNLMADKDIEMYEALCAIEQSAKFPLILPCIRNYMGFRIFTSHNPIHSSNLGYALDYVCGSVERATLREFIEYYNLCPENKTTLSFGSSIRYDLEGLTPVKDEEQKVEMRLAKTKRQAARKAIKDAADPDEILKHVNTAIEANLKDNSMLVAQSLRAIKIAMCNIKNIDDAEIPTFK